MDEYEFLETEAGSGERGSGGRNREVAPLRKQQGGGGGQMGSQQGNNRPNSTQESPLRRALEQPPLKRFKVTFIPCLVTTHNSFEVRSGLCSTNHGLSAEQFDLPHKEWANQNMRKKNQIFSEN